MNKLSRRVLARYICDELGNKTPVHTIAKRVIAELEVTNRRAQLPMLIDDVSYELERRGLLALATVTTAHQPSTALLANLEACIAALTNTKQVTMNHILNPRVIGGVEISTATLHIDTTIKKQLTQLRKA